MPLNTKPWAKLHRAAPSAAVFAVGMVVGAPGALLLASVAGAAVAPPMSTSLKIGPGFLGVVLTVVTPSGCPTTSGNVGSAVTEGSGAAGATASSMDWIASGENPGPPWKHAPSGNHDAVSKGPV